MNKREVIIAAALNGIIFNTHAHSPSDVIVTQEVEKCYGIQKKEQNGCSISKEDITAANQAFKNKYKKSTTFECAGNVPGSAAKGYLAWVYVAKNSCHKIEGGFLIVKDSKGNKVVDKGQ